MLNHSELLGMQVAAAAALPEAAAVIRPTHRSDGLGGMVTDDVIVTSCPARIGLASQADTVTYAEKLGAQVGYRIVLPGFTDVQPRDRVQIGERRFEVVAAPNRGTWEITKNVIAMEVVQ